MVFSYLTYGQAQSDENHKANQQQVKVKIFPNPAVSVINILGLTDTEKAIIIVTDIYGNTVLRHEWEIRNQALNVSVANLEKGIYGISILSPEQHINTKFYKQ
jgi:hypothetical protein